MEENEKEMRETFQKVKRQINEDHKVKVDQFVKDVHTGQKKDDKAMDRFRNEGAHVENECEMFNFQFLKQEY